MEPRAGFEGAEMRVPASVAMFERAHRLVRRLVLVYGGFVAASLLLLSVPAWPFRPKILATLAAEAVAGGFGAAVLTPCVLALTGLAGALLLTAARRRAGLVSGSRGPGFAARPGQATVLPVGAALTGLAAVLLWPSSGPAVAQADATFLAAFAFAFAFVSLVSERFLKGAAPTRLPEAAGLRRLLLLATVLLALAGCAEVLRGAGLGWAAWVFAAVAVVAVAVAAELALRGAARLFVPAPAPDRATSAGESILAALLTGGPRAPGALIRSHLGLDFARNWAITFLLAAAPPAVLLTALFCWALSGLKLIDGSSRGVYERLGAPVAVLGPGLHLLLPWPLGRLRPVELGEIHTVAVGSDAPPEAGDEIAADDVPPPSANRLWTTAHATEVNYLVASQNAGVQGFQLVSTEILVQFRTGLTDRDAWEATYGAASQDTAVREAAARLLTRYFGRRTLDEVIGAQPQTLADALRRDLAEDVARSHAGIEILGVVFAEVHPPAGAAAAYHQVQAAEINALAAISNETGRATRAAAVAQQESHRLLTGAQAKAAETAAVAAATSVGFEADLRAYAASPRSFLLERGLKDVGTALAQTPLTLVDHRLGAGQDPVLDLRALGGAGGAQAADVTAGFAQPDKEDQATAGTFSPIPPGATADTAPPQPDATPDAGRDAPP